CGVEQQCVLVGSVEHAEVPQYLAAMDIAAAPYQEIADFYFSPLKIFEYLAAGKPVIAPRLGQIAEVVREEETGLLYTRAQVDGLAQRLLALATQADLRAVLGSQAAQDASRRFTWQATARQVVAISEEAGREFFNLLGTSMRARTLECPKGID